MSKKTTFREGACFGYFDREFEECCKCKLMTSCYRATKSDQVEEIRSIPKTTTVIIDDLSKKWKQEKELTIEEISETERTQNACV